MACELSQFLLIKFSTLDCGSIHEYPRRHLHLLDSLTYSSFRRKFQITGTDLEPKILVNSRLFLCCPNYTATTNFSFQKIRLYLPCTSLLILPVILAVLALFHLHFVQDYSQDAATGNLKLLLHIQSHTFANLA